MAKSDVANFELKLARGKMASRITLPGADVRELLEIADRADDLRIEKLERLRKKCDDAAVKLNGSDFRALMTLAIKAQKRKAA